MSFNETTQMSVQYLSEREEYKSFTFTANLIHLGIQINFPSTH